MSARKNVLLVMAGGQGTRFWPVSVKSNPKQYLKLFGDKSLLENTLDRFEKVIAVEDRYVITVTEQKELAIECSNHKIARNGVIIEPEGRNTAPCILLALINLLSRGYCPDDVVVIVPSDHHINDIKEYQKTVEAAIDLATKDKLIVTIGIVPTSAHTGFGYIQKGKKLDENGYLVSSFKEKPSHEIAKEYLKSGNFLWNAGMFVASIKTLLEEFASCALEIYSFGNQLMDSIEDQHKVAQIYKQIPKNSIDYAVMEKSSKIAVLPGIFGWNDLGSWDAIEQLMDKCDENYIAKAKASFMKDAHNNIVYAPKHFVSLIGVDDLVVVINDHAVVVMNKQRAQEVKDVVEYLKDKPDLQELIK